MQFWGCGPVWPYPDQNSANMDWVIKIVRDLKTQWDNVQEVIRDTINQILPGEVQKQIQVALAPIQQQVNQNILDISVLYERLQKSTEGWQKADAQIREEHAVDVAGIRKEIEDLRFTLPEMIDPESGELLSLQQILFNLYFSSYDTWISPNEFDALNITPNEFDALNITPVEYDRSAKTILEASTNRPE